MPTMKHRKKMAVVVVPFPMQGHLSPLLRLSRRIARYKVTVHYVGSAATICQASSRSDVEWLDHETKHFHLHTFPTPPFPNFSPNSNSRYPSHLIPMISATLLAFQEPLFSMVNKLATKYTYVVVIFDALMASTVQLSLHSIPNVQFYAFETSSAFSIYWENFGNPTDSAEIMRELPSTEGCYTPEFKQFVDYQYAIRDFHCGTIFNSCRLTEGFYLDLLENTPSYALGKKIWALGPVNPVDEHERAKSGYSNCVEWIYTQPSEVLLVSFGAASSLSDEQIRELALGLERSGVGFVWLLRDADRGDIFADGVRTIELPQGFEERVRDRGLVVREWESQLEILVDRVDGFLTNCGWNSCMESITTGVPIIAWPMHSDQPRNAELMTKVLGLGFEIRDWGRRDEVVSSFVVEEAVKRLMDSAEGDEMRNRAGKLAKLIHHAWYWNDFNACYFEMKSFVRHIRAFH